MVTIKKLVTFREHGNLLDEAWYGSLDAMAAPLVLIKKQLIKLQYQNKLLVKVYKSNLLLIFHFVPHKNQTTSVKQRHKNQLDD